MMKRLLLVAMLGCSALWGQTADGLVSGQVREPNGKFVGPLQVYLSGVDPGNRTSMVVRTNDAGFFQFNTVPPGQYHVSASAIVATFLPGTVDAVQAIVSVPNKGFGTVPPGAATFFPGTADPSMATAITVATGAYIGNVNFVLAAGASPSGGPALQKVPGKIVVEGGGKPTLRSDQLSLFFSDGPGNVSANVTFLDGPRRAGAPSTRLERSLQGFFSATGLVPMPEFPDGDFRVSLPEGVYRVIQPAPPGGAAGTHLGSNYYIKGMSFGAQDLMKELMTVRTPVRDTLVITLAKCTDTTEDPMCR